MNIFEHGNQHEPLSLQNSEDRQMVSLRSLEIYFIKLDFKFLL
jgi:hypothetical protein